MAPSFGRANPVDQRSVHSSCLTGNPLVLEQRVIAHGKMALAGSIVLSQLPTQAEPAPATYH